MERLISLLQEVTNGKLLIHGRRRIRKQNNFTSSQMVSWVLIRCKERIRNEYVSDPNKPVPHQDGVQTSRTREYMIDDQRFASKRPDVMVYQTDALQGRYYFDRWLLTIYLCRLPGQMLIML